MNDGMNRAGLDAAFLADEARKSNLLLQAVLLRAQGQEDAAAAQFADAAAVEEGLAAQCRAQNLPEKARLHQFSAMSAWAQAGDFHHALTLSASLLADADAPETLRIRVQRFADALRARRPQWGEEWTDAAFA